MALCLPKLCVSVVRKVHMSTHIISGVTLTIMQGNIVDVHADAIVNAANAALAGGGGVDGAIHRAGGPTILEECRRFNGCPTGSAVATTAGRLHARYVFHAVGPIYGSQQNAPSLLARAYSSCLELAEQYSLKSIAFPSLSTGAYGYPVHLAAPIALQTILTHMQNHTTLQEILFVLYNGPIHEEYEDALTQLLNK